MPITDSDADARLLLQRLLLELGLTPDLDELDRQVAADPSVRRRLDRRDRATT